LRIGKLRDFATVVAEGRGEAGIAKIGEGMLVFEAAGDNRLYDMSSYVAISAYFKMHRVADGIALVERALSRIARGGMRLFEADLHPFKGEFLLMEGRPENEAEAAFRKAIAVAGQRQAKSFELRATMSLARLLAQQGRQAEARTMLADIYSWFTEGFNTADLKDAKALLDKLSS
jgi:ATP/maltotriose-dependent transcriptional regulator MalT